MNFTREPIIETVITPREGMKLLVRNSKGSGQEDYYVDAVEVVSFGHSFFFRSLERPKSFLVPVSDYEILELKEVRMPLKNAGPERSIKIGGGREGGRPPRESMPEEREPLTEGSFERSERPEDRPMDRKRDNKRRRGRRGGGRHEPMMQEMRERPQSEEPLAPEGKLQPVSEDSGEEKKSPSFISKLFPPPPTLIKETLSRYKPAEPEPQDEEVFPRDEEKFEEELFETPNPTEPKTEADDEETPFED